ncbi:MAG: tyrosine--tRNA ligase [Acetobacterales bacterium]
MTAQHSDLMRVLAERGYVHQCTDAEGLDAALHMGPVTAYVGYDCTADSLHIGHLVSIMMLRRLQQAGHRPIVLMGGGTTKIGDPSGKDEARKLLTDRDIAANMASIRQTFESFLDFGAGPTGAVMVNNADWLDGLNYIAFLRDYGRHFSVNRMLSFDSVKLRLEREQPLSFLEFNYMILQAYDFVELHRQYGCRLQMGGSDQWGNIVNGVELGRRTGGEDGEALFGLTCPLILTASGEKMGKTAGGAVWLAAHRMGAFDYWQFWRNTDDRDVGRFLRLFTDLPTDDIARVEALQGAEINEGKKLLATEATALLHGRAEAEAAAETARRTFEEGAAGDGLPQIDVLRGDLEAGVPAIQLLVQAGLASSNGDARRLIRGGGGRLNDAPITDEKAMVTLRDLGAGGSAKLSAGRKRHALVRAV